MWIQYVYSLLLFFLSNEFPDLFTNSKTELTIIRKQTKNKQNDVEPTKRPNSTPAPLPVEEVWVDTQIPVGYARHLFYITSVYVFF